jgi:hypothetical protein
VRIQSLNNLDYLPINFLTESMMSVHHKILCQEKRLTNVEIYILRTNEKHVSQNLLGFIPHVGTLSSCCLKASTLGSKGHSCDALVQKIP